MNIESRRVLQLLEEVEQDSTITQRTLAARLDIALGLTNLYLKRLIHKGYITCATVPPNRLVYLVTPRGITRKARLTYEFMKYSLNLYRDVRRQLRRRLDAGVVRGHSRVAIYGTGEAAEIAYLSIKERGLSLVAIFDGRKGGQFMGLPVLGLKELQGIGYDVLIVAVLDGVTPTVNRLITAGVPKEKLVTLQGWPLKRTRSEQAR